MRPSRRTPSGGLPRAATGLIAAVAFSVAAGCAGEPPALDRATALADSELGPALKALPPTWTASPLMTLGLAPIIVRADAQAGTGTASWQARVDTEALGAMLTSDLRLIFPQVLPLAATLTAIPGHPSSPETRQRAFLDAARKNAGIIVQVTLTSMSVSADRYYLTWVPNLLLYAEAFFPFWGVPDMEFAARSTATIELFGTAGEHPLCPPIEVRGEEVTRVLNMFQRGFSIPDALFGLFLAPSFLDDDNRKAIEQRLDPPALHELRRATLIGAAAAVRDFHGPEALESKDATTFALLVGVHRYAAEAIRGPAAAPTDLEAVTGILASMKVPEKNVVRLLDRDATLSQVRAEVASVASRARRCDSIFIYFSGCGTVEGPAGHTRPVLLPVDADPAKLDADPAEIDADPAKLETALSLKELRELLRGSHARKIVVALDAAFHGAGRALDRRAPPDDAAFAAFTERGEQAVDLMLAASGDGSTGDMPGTKLGYFTFAFRNAARGPVTIEELFLDVSRGMELEAGLDGLVTAPALFRGGARVGRGVVAQHGPHWVKP